MISKKPHLLIIALLVGLSSCSDDSLTKDVNDKTTTSPVVTQQQISGEVKEQNLIKFSQILSKAVYDRQEVREFLKNEALMQIDNAYNVFYPIAKEKKIAGVSFEDILAAYAGGKSVLDSIESKVPLLNIHFPEIGYLKIPDLDVSDSEIPVYCGGKLYFRGSVEDSLGEDELPGFYILAVSESGSIRKRDAAYMRASVGLSLNSDFEYVDQSFNPLCSNSSSVRASSVGYDAPNKKYEEDGYVSQSDMDPVLIKAYNNSRNMVRAIIETSILPITNSFFTVKRFQKNK